MSEPWEAVADQLKETLIEEGKDFVKDQTEEYKDLMGKIALDIAKQKWIAMKGDTEELRKQAEDNLEFLQNSVENTLMQSQLELADRASNIAGKIMQVALKALPLLLI